MPTTTQQPNMAASDFNLEKLTTKQLSEHIAATIQTKGNIAVFGRRGSGKTEISKYEIKKANAHEVYINLSVMERVDLGGYPNIMGVSPEKKFVDFLLPSFYELMFKGDKPVVALLDEVDKADPSLWAPLLEFTQFHSINGNKFENLHSVIMTGNLISEGGSRPSLPLLDRAEKYLVTPDVHSWLEWAGKSGAIHPSITAFINDNHNELFGSVDPEDRYADPSPRGWHRASDILFKGEANNWSTDLLSQKVAGCIGKQASVKYGAYYQHYKELLPLVEDIFDGRNIRGEFVNLEPSKKLIVSMITCNRLATLCDATDASNPPPAIENVGKFLQFAPFENVLVAIRCQLTVDRVVKFDLDESPEWAALLAEIGNSVDDSK